MSDTSLHRIVVPDQINAAGLPPFLELLGQSLGAQIVCLDFAQLRRVSPAGMVALVATVTRWQHAGLRVLFENLDACAITGYLQRMDVLRACGVQMPEHFKRHESAGRFLPVRLIEHPVNDLGHAMAICVAPGGDSLEHPMSALYDLVWYVLTETANNARQHSGGASYASAQVTRSEGFVRLAIADNGKGILQSFRDAWLEWSLPMDDPAAIRKALEPFVSSKGNPTNEGVGLTLVSGLARLTKAMLMIVSGRGMLTMDGTGNIRTQLQRQGAVFHGTLLALTIPQNHVQDFAALLTAAKASAGLLHTPGSTATFAP